MVNRSRSQFIEFFAEALQAFLQELVNAVALLHTQVATMAGAIPITVGDVNFFILDLLLLLLPLPPQLFSIKKQLTINIKK
jgi:hypothetical protein